MKRIFWEDPYKKTHQTKIETILGNYFSLEETIIFSFSGGQESDRATINGIKVVNSKIENNIIYYELENEHHFKKGDLVNLEIDWDRRYKLMRLHFAAELILEIVTNTLKLEKIGAHIAEIKARIDFLSNENISLHFNTLLEKYNSIINQNLPIKTGYLDESNERRYWEITDFSKVSCGGTHVKSTLEVGLVDLKRVNIGKGKERIEITLK